ncbi:LytR/AlgR family response regulator transcription factor [Faecalicatena contorta]|uniref:Stage 0 sporulation protein A homolog n=1 Tax=Faecalicatena contorta TaxID=39482 RepID=A0A315ZNP8_9FIRM|nr:LytTR family DNA-binding domain-containing protein [Faecalicatena contorta]PWJ47255.1 LytTR family two component transcriptional regulator [Faecalicatena contorta]SUQ16098.1 DNA-binding response regulator, LytR/AlgR family [Faecalicatena contorta]
MLKIALCDDNSRAIKQYAELISQISKKHQINMEISCFDNGEILLFHYSDVLKETDIIYLDIMMGKIDGMETARRLRECGCKAQIVFLTSYEDYVYEAFDVNAVQYLLKENTSTERFEEVFLKVVELASKKEEELFTFEFDGKTSVIPIHQISHFEIWQRIVTVYYDNGKSAKFYSSMTQLGDKLLGKDFVRVHRSYLVHLPYIVTFRQQNILLKTGQSIPIGVTHAQSLKKAFSEYISRFHVYYTRNVDKKGEMS